MRILITGNMGYVGPIVVRHLRNVFPDAELVGLDIGLFGHCLTVPMLPERHLNAQIFCDVRDVKAEMLEGFDAIVHLAAVSNDPMGSRFETVTEDINWRASVAIAELAATAGVSRFVFASSCSVYGFAAGGARTERDEVNPLTAYARSKIATERALEQMPSQMVTTSLRFATACGFSPRTRLDLVLNDFVASAMATGKITVLSDGTPWRPLIHVADMARAIEWAIRRDADAGGQYLAVNVGDEKWNYQVKELAAAVAEQVQGVDVEINVDAPPDKRSYRVDFSLYASLAPDHQPQVTLKNAVEDLVGGLSALDFSDGAFRQSDLIRLRVLESEMESGRLGSNLRWR